MGKRSLNLSLDERTIERARRYSERHGTSISSLVGEYLSGLPEPGEDAVVGLSPTVRRLVGVARGGRDREGYRRHLREKYGVEDHDGS